MSESSGAPDIEGLSAEQLDALQERLDERAIERNTPEPSPGSGPRPAPDTTPRMPDASVSAPGGVLVKRLRNEVADVRFDPAESHGSRDPDGTVHVTFEHDGERGTISFPMPQWCSQAGYTVMFDGYYKKFGVQLSELTEWSWGILQTHLAHRWASTNHHHS